MEVKTDELNPFFLERGFLLYDFPSDGGCLYNSLSFGLFGTPTYHYVMRYLVVYSTSIEPQYDFPTDKTDDKLWSEDKLLQQLDPRQWGNLIHGEFVAHRHNMKYRVWCVSESNKLFLWDRENGFRLQKKSTFKKNPTDCEYISLLYYNPKGGQPNHFAFLGGTDWTCRKGLLREDLDNAKRKLYGYY